MALSGNIAVKVHGDTAAPTYGPRIGVAAGQTIYHGSLLCVETDGGAADGLLKVGATDSSLVCVGWNDGDQVDNSAGSNSDYYIAPRRGMRSIGISGSSIDANDIGKPCYIVDDDTVHLSSSSGTRPFGGIIRAMDGTRAIVEFGLAHAGGADLYDIPFVTTTASGLLTAEANLGALADGILTIDVTGGVAAIINRSMAVGSAALVVSNANGQAGNPTFDGSVALKALSALAGTGFVAQTAGAADNGTFAERSLEVGSASLTVSNPAGVAGNPSLDASVGLKAIDVLASTGFITQTGGAANNGTFAERSFAAGSAALTITNPAGTAGNPSYDASVALKAISAFAGTGFIAQTGGAADNGTFAERSIEVASAALTISNPAGVAGNPSIGASTALGNVSALAGTGFLVQSGGVAHAGTFVERSIAVSGAGLSIADGNGVGANPTISLANGVAAIEALAGTGIVVHTGADTYTERSIAVGGTALSVADPTGVAGNPTISASTALTNLSALAGTGIVVQSGGIADAGTFVERSIAVGSTALTVANPTGVAANPTLDASVALKALSGFAGTGFLAQTGGAADNGTFAERTLTVSEGLDVTNPAGVAGNPLIKLNNMFVRCGTIAATGGAGGSEAGSLTLTLTDQDGNAISVAKQVMICTSLTQYLGGLSNTLIATLTFSAASAGSIIASGTGWCLAKTDATGVFTCALTDTADETVWFSVRTAEAVSLLEDRCLVVGSLTDDATWAA